MVFSATVELRFHGDTADLLKQPAPGGRLDYPLTRRASIKDIIEALGVPHTEVGKIVSAREEFDFHLIPETGDIVDIYPFIRDIAVTAPTVLRPIPLSGHHFLADRTVLKLARNLRMVGLDTEASRALSLREIAADACRTERIVLTRNRDLLKIGCIVFGQLLRSTDHRRQLSEVIERFALESALKPFSRCLRCNEILQEIEKEQIIDQLEPLTQKYYHAFKRCPSCSQIYWRGTHHERMQSFVERIG